MSVLEIAIGKDACKKIMELAQLKMQHPLKSLLNIHYSNMYIIHTACILFWIPKRQAICTDNGFIFEKIN